MTCGSPGSVISRVGPGRGPGWQGSTMLQGPNCACTTWSTKVVFELVAATAREEAGKSKAGKSKVGKSKAGKVGADAARAACGWRSESGSDLDKTVSPVGPNRRGVPWEERRKDRRSRGREGITVRVVRSSLADSCAMLIHDPWTMDGVYLKRAGTNLGATRSRETSACPSFLQMAAMLWVRGPPGPRGQPRG